MLLSQCILLRTVAIVISCGYEPLQLSYVVVVVVVAVAVVVSRGNDAVLLHHVLCVGSYVFVFRCSCRLCRCCGQRCSCLLLLSSLLLLAAMLFHGIAVVVFAVLMSAVMVFVKKDMSRILPLAMMTMTMMVMTISTVMLTIENGTPAASAGDND